MGNHCLLEIHLVVMKQFVTLLAVVGSSLAAPAADPHLVKVAAPYINQGAASGPLTPAIGDLVATPKGYKSLALEGFSEDLNQDGFVDPIGQAVVPVVHHAPVVAAPAVAAYSVKAPIAATKVVAAPVVAATKVVAAPAVATYTVPAATTKVVAAPAVAAYHAAPVAVATAPVVQHVGYNVHHTVQHVPQVAVQKHVTHHVTQHVINHAPVVGAFTGLLPAGVAPVAAAEAAPVAAEAPAVEEA